MIIANKKRNCNYKLVLDPLKKDLKKCVTKKNIVTFLINPIPTYEN